MSDSSILGGEPATQRAEGRDVDALGPSDNSDSGSDVQGERRMSTGADAPDELGGMPVSLDGDSDSMGTGERASATGDEVMDGADIAPDRIFEPDAGEVSDEPIGDALDRSEAWAVGEGDIDDDEDDAVEGERDDEATPDAVARSASAPTADDAPTESASAGTGGRVFRVDAGTAPQ